MPKKGYKQTEEHKAAVKIAMDHPDVRKKRSRSIGMAMKMQWQDPEFAKMMWEAQNNPEAKEKKRISSKITNNLLEVKERKSQSQKLASARPEVKEKRCRSQKLAQNRPEVREKKSKSQKIAADSLLYKEKASKAQKAARSKDSWKEKQGRAQRIAQNRSEVKAKKSFSQKNKWQDLEFCKKQTESRAIVPNKPETFLTNLLNDLYPGEWKFVGDFSFMIGGKNPDFVNIDGQKKCIEHFGTHWHKGDNPQDRINLFKSYGWDCLIIWEHELKNFKALRRKIFDFAEE